MSTDNNVTEFPPLTKSSTITLDDVAQAMNDWRTNKKNAQEPIPDVIWRDVFILLKKFPESMLRTVLGISTTQFRRKLDEQRLSSTPPLKPLSEPSCIDFCEAKDANTITPIYKPAKIPATNTLVVEFCRADGRIMKIHTTTDSFAELMKAFFAGE